MSPPANRGMPARDAAIGTIQKGPPIRLRAGPPRPRKRLRPLRSPRERLPNLAGEYHSVWSGLLLERSSSKTYQFSNTRHLRLSCHSLTPKYSPAHLSSPDRRISRIAPAARLRAGWLGHNPQLVPGVWYRLHLAEPPLPAHVWLETAHGIVRVLRSDVEIRDSP